MGKFRAPIKFLDLIVISLASIFFIFLPVSPPPAPAVRGATTLSQILLIPRFTGQAPPDVSAQAVFIYDPESQTVLWERNSRERFYPASTTKLMTALVALSYYQTDSILTVKNGGQALGNKIELKEGEQLTLETLLYGLLVSSGNDAALTLAENYPGGYSAFIAAMNDRAAALGLSETHFTNPSGVINPDHYTTARDLTLIAREAITNPLIRKIVATPSITLTDVSGKREFYLESTNKLLGLSGVRGLKTGWAPESGECLVTLVVRDGHPLLITLLDSQDRFGESQLLMDWAYANFTWESL